MPMHRLCLVPICFRTIRFSPRPAWQVIEAARRQYLTGELTLHTTPTTRVFLRDGVVYFAERSTDGTLAIRLMMEGIITREQMQRGTVIVNGVEHVGRMFDADPTIDRASVELAPSCSPTMCWST